MFKKKENKEDLKLNSNHTLAWKEKTANNTRQSKFRESLYRSKSSMVKKSMYLIVILPDKEQYHIEDYDDPEERIEIHEWWAENTVDFLNELQLIYSVLSENNDAWKQICEKAQKNESLGYPKNVQYKWKANRDTQPKCLPVDVYIDHVIFWCNSQVENEDIFPTDEDIPFPPTFRKSLAKMYQRMFRIFAIIQSNPALSERKDVESSLDLCFKHFLFFAWKWSLLDPKETKCVDKFIAPLRQKFDRDEKAYRNHKLALDD